MCYCPKIIWLTLIHGQVFSGVDSDRIQLNHDSLWTGGPFQNKSYTGNNGDPSQKANKASGIASLRKEIWSKGQVPVEDATTLYGSFGRFDKKLTSDIAESQSKNIILLTGNHLMA